MRRSPQLRTAYGPRERRPYVDDHLTTLTARQCERQDFATRTVPMPNGGARELVRCPWCHDWRARLYLSFVWGCRHCLGLRYRSQYEGRRLEADPARVERYERRGGNPACARAARDLRQDREDAYHIRRVLANLKADLGMLGIIERDQRRMATEARYRRLYRAGWRAGQPVPLITRRRPRRVTPPDPEMREIIDGIFQAIRIDLDMLALYDVAPPVRLDQFVRRFEAIAALSA